MAPGTHKVEMTPEEQQEWIQKARDLAPEFDKRGEEADKNNQFPHDLVPLYKEAGFPGVAVPKKYGGAGGDILTVTQISRELAKGDPACALAFNMHQVMVGILAGTMSDENNEKWLSRVAQDNLLICGGFSEERAGFSGIADTTAEVQPDGGYKVNGRKVWCTLSEAADIATFNCTITEADGKMSDDLMGRLVAEQLFIADKDTPGISVIRTWDTHGMRATGTQTLAFDDAIIPADARVGDMRTGGLIANFEWAAMTFGGCYLGLAEKAFETARQILVEKSIGATAGAMETALRDVGFVQHGLGEMKVKVEQAARVLEMTCLMLIEGRDLEWNPLARPGLLDVVKATTTQNAKFVADNAMRLIGGSTFRRGHELERLYRDSRSGPFQPMTTDQTYDHLGKFELGLMEMPAPPEAGNGQPAEAEATAAS